MTRGLFAGALGLLLLAGCGDARRPAVRGGAAESASPSAAPAEMGDSFHGTPHGTAPSEPLGPEVDLDGASLRAPENWIRKQTRSDFFLAEFTLPHAEGDAEDGRLTVTSVGGSVEANVDRWRQQFQGKPEQDSQQELSIGGVKVALIDFSGTYGDQHMGFAPAGAHPGYRMLAAIFSVEGRQYIIKCYGPEKTIAENAKAFRAFLDSMRLAKAGSVAPATQKATQKAAISESKPAPGEPSEAESREGEAPAAESTEAKPPAPEVEPSEAQSGSAESTR